MTFREREPQLFADLEKLKEQGYPEIYDQVIAFLAEYEAIEELATLTNPPKDLPARTETMYKNFKKVYIDMITKLDMPPDFTFLKKQ